MLKILIAFLGLGLLTAAIAPAHAGTTCWYENYSGRPTWHCS